MSKTTPAVDLRQDKGGSKLQWSGVAKHTKDFIQYCNFIKLMLIFSLLTDKTKNMLEQFFETNELYTQPQFSPEQTLENLASRASWQAGKTILKGHAGREWSHDGVIVEVAYDEYLDDRSTTVKVEADFPTIALYGAQKPETDRQPQYLKAVISDNGMLITQPVNDPSNPGKFRDEIVTDADQRALLLSTFINSLGSALDEVEAQAKVKSDQEGKIVGYIGKLARRSETAIIDSLPVNRPVHGVAQLVMQEVETEDLLNAA